MRWKMACAGVALCVSMGAGVAPALAQSGEITVWSWNIAASSLKAVIPGFNKQFADINVVVEDLGNSQVFDKTLAGCAAGGEGLPDVISIENGEAEIFWSRFPDCFIDLNTLGYQELAGLFPDFKRTELEVGDKAFAMPWDSGPVAMFYRRDLYENAGVDPATIKTWDDFIAAGKKISEANPGVVMSQADFNADTEWFRMLAGEQSCGYFALDAQSITVNQPGCTLALEKVKDMADAGTLTAADWNEKIQGLAANTVATQMYGGWYEGTVRSNLPEQAGKWGVYLMPSMTEDGAHAANLGGSSLAIAANSDNLDAAWEYVKYTLATVEGQVTMMREFGLVPSLLAALDDPFVAAEQEYWGGQKVWLDILGTMPNVAESRGTPFYGDANSIVNQVQLRYINGEYASAQEALDDAAKQISIATGLPVS